MKTKRIVASRIETAYGENPEYIGLIASSENESIEVVFETMKAPSIASSVLLSSQDAVKRIEPEKMPNELAWNLDTSMQILPDAVDIKVLADGDVLCVNVGSGALFFKLSEPAKRSLKEGLSL